MFSNLSESFLQSFGKKFSLTDKEEIFDVIMEFENLVNFEFYVKFHQINQFHDKYIRNTCTAYHNNKGSPKTSTTTS